VAETAEEIYGRKPVIAPTMAGTGPMYKFADILGMPIATSGVDHPSHKIHAPNENITEEDFLYGAKHAALIMQRFGGRGLEGWRTLCDVVLREPQDSGEATRLKSVIPT
jgi:acetylornithine deacetylase/succinyl-diaminopimelate desuccinylase-like protein